MLRVALFLGFLAYASAYVCSKDACATVRCANVAEAECTSGGGKFVANGGYCGCCDACRQQLAEGDSCMSMVLLGVSMKAECAPGLHCDPKTLKCVQDDAPCAAALLKAQNGPSLLGAPTPSCDGEGYYQPKQCQGSQCYCVSKNGKEISGYTANVWEAQQMTCQCARDQAEYMASGLIGKFFYCTSDGSYQTYQCQGDVCFCADTNGVKMDHSPSVHISQVTKLNCKTGF
ncbi:hypothetical protein FSP39_022068 [Pinctada imbricata]|uniref:Thyroglobulin type-1 domain-containing protein n=1 Tax=Pinctada imbricata TaxID=66713 RepID=A0AA88YS40_PINIB|nr:hypothetical protein FSP39_022068 [Pinctada imbricata]